MYVYYSCVHIQSLYTSVHVYMYVHTIPFACNDCHACNAYVYHLCTAHRRKSQRDAAKTEQTPQSNWATVNGNAITNEGHRSRQ